MGGGGKLKEYLWAGIEGMWPKKVVEDSFTVFLQNVFTRDFPNRV